MNTKRRFILLLALLLMIQPLCCIPALADEKVDLYVRAFVPKKGNDDIGHYDLLIRGSCRYRGVTLTNPVISYNADGRVYIFNESNTERVYKSFLKSSNGGYTTYRWHLRVSRATLSAFMKGLNKQFSNVSRNSYMFRCKLKSSNIFHKYDNYRTNCFTAVACWLNAIGNERMINYYFSGKSIAPATVVKKLSGFKK